MLLTTETPREAELINDINDVKVGWEVMEYFEKRGVYLNSTSDK
jgi:hypothetical protein